MNDINNQDIVWQNPLNQPTLTENQIHIWRANLDLPTATIEELATILSSDEIARANRFRFTKDRNRFIAARSILRQLLGNYLQITPDKLEFEYSDRGKPRLSALMPSSSLQFNVSHSHEYALYGFIYEQAIGVDIEYLREMSDAVKIAERFFSPKEFQLIASCPEDEQHQVFFKFWTAKEAYLKAVGTGLAGSIADVEISLDHTECPKLLAIQGNKTTAASWSMYSCIPANNYLATIAVDTSITPQQVYFWHY
ncbi:MAG: 4'-phosphopantetheinyl transferase family protein [Waterburya sp.]